MLKAKEIMTQQVITVEGTTIVETAAKLMAEHKITGLPVVDQTGVLIGIVTEADLVARNKTVRLPAILPLLDAIIFLENPKRFEEDLKRMAATKVEELMSTDLLTATVDTSLEELATIMTEEGVNRLPVVDEAGKVIGIVSRGDIVKALISK